MNKIRTMQPSKKPVVKKNIKIKKNFFNQEIIKKLILIIVLIFILIAVGFYAFNLYKKMTFKPNWISNIDINQKITESPQIPEISTVSIKSKEMKDLKIVETETATDNLTLSIKKIDNKNSLWFIHNNLNFHCVSTFEIKCSIEVILDSKKEILYYDGGNFKKIYIMKSEDFIKKIKNSKKLIVNVNMQKVFKNNEDKILSNSSGKFIDYMSKEYTFNVEGLKWD